LDLAGFHLGNNHRYYEQKQIVSEFESVIVFTTSGTLSTECD